MRKSALQEIAANERVGACGGFVTLGEGGARAEVAEELQDEMTLALLGGFLTRLGSSESFSCSGAGVVSPRLGRGSILREHLGDGTGIVVRRFLRGGMVRRILGADFLRLPGMNARMLRPFHELHISAFLFRQHVRVPRPLAAYVESNLGGLFYQGLIITEEIRAAANLLSLLVGQKKCGVFEQELCFFAGREAARMLSCGVFHRDLHPGNVLVDNTERVFLIDFDKASWFDVSRDRERISRRLVQRWRKSLVRHFGPSDSRVCSYREAYEKGLREGRK